MRKFNFWDVNDDCPIEEGFNGTLTQAKKRAITLAKKYNTIVCVENGDTYDDVLCVDEKGNDVYY